ncbi:MAG: hypothetical protein FD143_827 [Ignavibacteria bacterium]|nr:MAG: hypothetical protein FD143_827 [Ignavibacteria bacterium]KAF0160587.1 MAG: hypothetical protein FD188_1579 [Ignavibacteria bacterium]
MGEPNFPQRIKAILINIYNGQHNHSEITDLVKISRVVVISHFSRNRKHTTYLCCKNGFSLADLAYDCIGEVFEKSYNGEFKNLKTFFASLNKCIHETLPAEVYVAYKSLLMRIAEAQEARLFAQFDPNGFKIIRNIKEKISEENLFVLVKKNNELVLKFSTIEQSNSLPYLSVDDITTDFISLAKNGKSTVQFLNSLYKVIETQINCRKEILLSDAVELFKRVYGISDKFNGASDDNFENLSYQPKLGELEIGEIRIKVLCRLKEKILLNYYAKGKITKEQANAMYSSLDDLINDWIELGTNSDSFYEYFNSRLEINKREYQIHIKDKMEYLVKEARKEFALLIYSKN